jgi:hypothetical protein
MIAWSKALAMFFDTKTLISSPSSTRPPVAGVRAKVRPLGALPSATRGPFTKRRAPLSVVLDGFITAAAALVAARLCPNIRPWLVASHRSTEPGHGVVLRELDLGPLLQLDLRLGEGTGAAWRCR